MNTHKRRGDPRLASRGHDAVTAAAARGLGVVKASRSAGIGASAGADVSSLNAAELGQGDAAAAEVDAKLWRSGQRTAEQARNAFRDLLDLSDQHGPAEAAGANGQDAEAAPTADGGASSPIQKRVLEYARA